MTDAEQAFWKAVRRKRLGVRIRRQFGLGPYIADFYIPELQLVIEIDGSIHEEMEQKTYDQERNEYMRELGFTVLRFTNKEIESDLEAVIAAIQLQFPLLTKEGARGRSRPKWI